jgi:hypothetical protein
VEGKRQGVVTEQFKTAERVVANGKPPPKSLFLDAHTTTKPQRK